ncbi:MAG: LPS assembly lipoprotein LptE [Hyphomicrobiaceae bacterium]
MAAGLALLLVGGCSGGDGFRPMYAATATSPGVQEKLAKIDVAPIPSRVGQRLRNELIFEKTGGGLPEKPEYRLEIVIREALASTLVTSTGEAQSQIYTLDANFRLVRLNDKKVVFQGASHGRAGFERFQQIYSNVRARDDAENRAARTVADDIKTRLAATLSSNRI